MITIHCGSTDTRGFNQHFQLCSTHTMRPMNADPNSPDVGLASVSLITSSDWQTHTTMSSAHLPILIGLQTNATSSPARHRTYINTKKTDWTEYRQKIERKLSSRHLPTDCQKDETVSRVTLLKDASIISQLEDVSYTSPSGEILAMMQERDDLRKQDSASPRLSTMNYVRSAKRHRFTKEDIVDNMVKVIYVMISRSCGPAGWLPMLFIKAGDVETNPGPTTTRKQVWICDICHRQIQVRKQISIWCNRIEHWVHLRCTGIRLAQYTDEWTCHPHR